MDPLFWASVISLVLGSGAQYMGAKKQDKKAAAALGEFADRIRTQSDRANSIFEESLAGQDVETAEQAIDTAAEQKIARVTDLASDNAYTPTLPGQDNASRVVQDSNRGQLSRSIAEARAKLAAQAELEGFTQRTLDRGVELQRSGNEFVDIGTNSRAARGLLDTGMLAAQNAGRTEGLLGDVLVSLGMLGLTAGGGPGAKGVLTKKAPTTINPSLAIGAPVNTAPAWSTFTSPSTAPVLFG